MMLFFCSGCEVIRFSFVYSEMHVNSCKAYTQTLMNETVPTSITAANNSFLIIHSFLLTASNMNAKCLYRTRFKSSLPSQHNQSSWEFRSHNPYSISFSSSVHFIPKLYLHSPPHLLMTYCNANCSPASFAPHLIKRPASIMSKDHRSY